MRAYLRTCQSFNELAATYARPDHVEVIPFVSRTETNVVPLSSRHVTTKSVYLLDYCSPAYANMRPASTYLNKVRRSPNSRVTVTNIDKTISHPKRLTSAETVERAQIMREHTERILAASAELFDFASDDEDESDEDSMAKVMASMRSLES